MAVASTISSNIWRQRVRVRLIAYGAALALVLGSAVSGHLPRPTAPLLIAAAGLSLAIPVRRFANAAFFFAVAFDAVAVIYLAMMADSFAVGALALIVAGAVFAVGRHTKTALPVALITLVAIIGLVLGEQGVIPRPDFIPRLEPPADAIAAVIMAIVLAALGILVVSHLVHLYGRAAIGVEDNTRRWWQFMEASDQPMLVTVDGAIAHANQAAAVLAGRGPDDLDGSVTGELVDQGRLVRPDGSIVHVATVTAPIALDGRLAQVMFLTDTSHQEERRRDLERTVRDNGAFLASISHEVRTPLTAVVGLSAVAEEAWEDLSAQEQRDFVRLIASQSRDVAAIIEDLLVAARVGTTDVNVSAGPVDLRSEIDRVLEGLTMENRTVVVTGEGRVTADAIRVRQVLRNLVTNAFRYGGSDIEVAITSSGAMVEIEVSDNGSPISEESREAIFRPFSRTDTSTRIPDSVGLGLSVSRQLAELMKGSLEYRHHDGRSRFILTLPGDPG